LVGPWASAPATRACSCTARGWRSRTFDEDTLMDTQRDAMLDLLPLYLAGEARPGTRQLVTEYLSRHPELAEQVRQQAETEPDAGEAVLSPELEARALLRTR